MYYPYPYNYQIVVDLPSNYLPIELLLQLHKIIRRTKATECTDWKAYANFYNKININTYLINETDIDI